MNIKTCKFVEMSDLFAGCRDMWDVFCDTDPECSWGDNNRTLVTAGFILGHLENVIEDSDDPLLKIFSNRCKSLPDGLNTYVDLEN